MGFSPTTPFTAAGQVMDPSATLTAADLMAWGDSVGSIEKGKYADLIAVEGDPLADIYQLQCHLRDEGRGSDKVLKAITKPVV